MNFFLSHPLKKILTLIVVSQFCCTSLWFAGNAIIDDLIINFNLNSSALSSLTSSIQFGFICGTLLFALLTITDRYSPSKVFFYSALLAALCNISILYKGNVIWSLIGFRFLTGFFLAGIYPVGMKIASDYFKKGLGKSLSLLVGALVLGTAFPHLLKSYPDLISWQIIVLTTSALTIIGGLIIFSFVPDGPHQKLASKFDVKKIIEVFQVSEFKKASFGYFGHMWELYTFWTFTPLLLYLYNSNHADAKLNISLLAFTVISIGAIGCIIGGYLSEKIGAKKTAKYALIISGICCLLSPLMLFQNSSILFIIFLLIWSISVIADSPLLSALIANSVKPESKGTALTISTCIGFFITIMSIQLLSYFRENLNIWAFTILALGPLFSLISLRKKS
jgi:MFS family permease